MGWEKIGFVIGVALGFLFGASINFNSDAPNLLGRVTGGVIVQDPEGLGFSLFYAVMVALFMGIVVAAIFMSIEEIRNLIAHQS